MNKRDQIILILKAWTDVPYATHDEIADKILGLNGNTPSIDDIVAAIWSIKTPFTDYISPVYPEDRMREEILTVIRALEKKS